MEMEESVTVSLGLSVRPNVLLMTKGILKEAYK